jgi:hypothetical protein
MQSEVKRRIVKIARERMERECASDFGLLRGFGTPKTRRFLQWIGQITPDNRIEAALSITNRQLGLMHLGSASPPALGQWVESFLAVPLNVGLRLDWKPGIHRKSLATCVKKTLGPFRDLGAGSFDIPEGNPLFIAGVRTVVALNTKLSDIAILQFVRDEAREYEVSYLGLIGMGQTGWLFGPDEEVEQKMPVVRDVIAKAGEIAHALA